MNHMKKQKTVQYLNEYIDTNFVFSGGAFAGHLEQMFAQLKKHIEKGGLYV
jgi:hypothetical protein